MGRTMFGLNAQTVTDIDNDTTVGIEADAFPPVITVCLNCEFGHKVGEDIPIGATVCPTCKSNDLSQVVICPRCGAGRSSTKRDIEANIAPGCYCGSCGQSIPSVDELSKKHGYNVYAHVVGFTEKYNCKHCAYHGDDFVGKANCPKCGKSVRGSTVSHNTGTVEPVTPDESPVTKDIVMPTPQLKSAAKPVIVPMSPSKAEPVSASDGFDDGMSDFRSPGTRFIFAFLRILIMIVTFGIVRHSFQRKVTEVESAEPKVVSDVKVEKVDKSETTQSNIRSASPIVVEQGTVAAVTKPKIVSSSATVGVAPESPTRHSPPVVPSPMSSGVRPPSVSPHARRDVRTAMPAITAPTAVSFPRPELGQLGIQSTNEAPTDPHIPAIVSGVSEPAVQPEARSLNIAVAVPDIGVEVHPDPMTVAVLVPEINTEFVNKPVPLPLPDVKIVPVTYDHPISVSIPQPTLVTESVPQEIRMRLPDGRIVVVPYDHELPVRVPAIRLKEVPYDVVIPVPVLRKLILPDGSGISLVRVREPLPNGKMPVVSAVTDKSAKKSPIRPINVGSGDGLFLGISFAVIALVIGGAAIMSIFF